MGDGPTFVATFIAEDGTDSNTEEKSLEQRYLVQADVDQSGRIFIDVTNIVMRARSGTLPNSGEYYLDQSDDWYEKHGKEMQEGTEDPS